MKALNMLDPLQVDHSSLIPPHSSLFTTDRQRRSVPLNAASSLRRRPANHVNVNPASAEVISSLISTLSAISPPSYQHSDHLPENFCHSTPSSPQNADFAFITSPAGDVEGRDSKQSAGIRFDMDNERGETPSRRTGKVPLSLIQALDLSPYLIYQSKHLQGKPLVPNGDDPVSIAIMDGMMLTV